jgi:hypothetical protein
VIIIFTQSEIVLAKRFLVREWANAAVLEAWVIESPRDERRSPLKKRIAGSRRESGFSRWEESAAQIAAVCNRSMRYRAFAGATSSMWNSMRLLPPHSSRSMRPATWQARSRPAASAAPISVCAARKATALIWLPSTS